MSKEKDALGVALRGVNRLCRLSATYGMSSYDSDIERFNVSTREYGRKLRREIKDILQSQPQENK